MSVKWKKDFEEILRCNNYTYIELLMSILTMIDEEYVMSQIVTGSVSPWTHQPDGNAALAWKQ